MALDGMLGDGAGSLGRLVSLFCGALRVARLTHGPEVLTTMVEPIADVVALSRYADTAFAGNLAPAAVALQDAAANDGPVGW